MVQHLSEEWLGAAPHGWVRPCPSGPAPAPGCSTWSPARPTARSPTRSSSSTAASPTRSLGRDDDAADCTFLDHLRRTRCSIAQGELDLHAGFMQGRVKMSGDMGRLMAVLPCTQSDEYRAALAEVAAATDF